jgi:hypothetical protein
MTRAYGLFLCLYPRSYRKAFAAEMAAVFEQSAHEQRSLGRLAFIHFLVVEAASLLWGSGIEWFSTLSDNGEHSCDLASAVDSSLPAEIIEAQQRIRYNLRGMEHAIAHHQFERARLFSAADRQARECLRSLWLSYRLPGEPRTEP